MFRIVIEWANSSTVIHNITEDELDYWHELLNDNIRGKITIVDEHSGKEVDATAFKAA